MDRRLIWIGICAGIGAIAGVAIGDVLHASHAIADAVAGLGGGLGALAGTLIVRGRVA